MLHLDKSSSSDRELELDRGPELAAVGERQLDVLQQLAREIQQLETSGHAAAAKAAISAGSSALDALLPSGGYVPGSVIEYLRSTPACGASTLAWAAAAAAMQAGGGFLVVVDTGHNLYPPALTSHGIDLAKVIFVRPQSQLDAIWAVDQALRTTAVAAVVAELERIDDRAARRLQLAAEKGQGLALLLRGSAARKQPSWAEVQWLVGPSIKNHRMHAPLAIVEKNEAGGYVSGKRSLQVQLVRVRGGKAGGTVQLEIDSLTGKLELASSHRAPTVAADNRQRIKHEQTATTSKSALHLASQLAHTEGRSRRAAAG